MTFSTFCILSYIFIKSIPTINSRNRFLTMPGPIQIFTISSTPFPAIIQIENCIHIPFPISDKRKSNPSKIVSLYIPASFCKVGITRKGIPSSPSAPTRIRKLSTPFSFIRSSSRTRRSRSPPLPVDPKIAPYQ